VALIFGLIARIVVEVQLTLPIPGTGVVTDPREIFTTIGSGLTGPVGAVLIGILAGIREPGGIQWASLLAHISGALWVGFAYKKLVYERLRMPLMLLGWAGLVLTYYFVVVIPGFVIGLAVFYGALDSAASGQPSSLLLSYAELAQGVIPEALLTTVITSLVLIALPKKYRRPLW
jgi:hypothetical protein